MITHRYKHKPHRIRKVEQSTSRGEKWFAIKIPSSFGRFIVDSCFFVSGPGEEGGLGGLERQKTKFKLDCICREHRKIREGKTEKIRLCLWFSSCIQQILTRITHAETQTLTHARPQNSSVLTAEDLVMHCHINDPRGHFSPTPLPISHDTPLLWRKINQQDQVITLRSGKKCHNYQSDNMQR